ncbi:3'(2'),5'-bisphosphate nucleotidase CysQ [Xanthobacteraceae bacterium A53D]
MNSRPPLSSLSALDAPEIAARHLADAVTAAGAVALAMFRSGAVASWTKTNDSPVTEADIAVDRFLNERLTTLAPDYGWLSEETADSQERLSRRRVWVVDPIDGTRAFMAGGQDWTVSAALVEDGRPVAAALFAPVTDELFIASAGGGARRNGVPLQATTRTALDGAAVSGPASVVDRLARHADIQRQPRVRSLALRIARVASAELDVALATSNAYDWDIAAADLLVQEAHGFLSDLDGRALTYNATVPRHGALLSAGRPLHDVALAAARAADTP